MKFFILAFMLVLTVYISNSLDDNYHTCDEDDPNLVNVGVMLFDDSFHGEFLKDIIRVKSRMVSEQYNVCLSLNFSYDYRDSIVAYNKTIEYIDKNMNVMIGPTTSPQTEIVSGVIDNKIAKNCVNDLSLTDIVPDISFQSISSIFDRRTVYPYLFKTFHNNKDMGSAWTMLMQYYGWGRCALISTLDTYGVTSASEFSKTARSIGIDVHQEYYPDSSTNDLEEALKRVKNLDYRIIFVTTSELETLNVLTKAKDLGMDEKEYVWVLTDINARWLYYNCSWYLSKRTCNETSNDTCSFEKDCYYNMSMTPPAFDDPIKPHCQFEHNSLFVSPNPGYGEEWKNFINEFRSATGINDPNPYYLQNNFLGEYLVDAIEGVALAFDSNNSICKNLTCNKENFENCRSKFSQDYEGVTGWVNMDQPRNLSFDIINIRHEKSDNNYTAGNFYVIGTWVNTTLFSSESWKQQPGGYYSSCQQEEIISKLSINPS